MYGVVRLGAKEAEFIVKPLGASGTADPLNQRGTVGYKYPFATRKKDARLKSKVIDLEARRGDKGQAEHYALAA